MQNLEKGFDICVIADYGKNDPAFNEVGAQLRAESRRNGDIVSATDYLAVVPFSTISTGFWIRQIGIENGYPGLVVFSNTAPRGNKDAVTWEGDERQRLLYGVLKNDVQVFAVSTGYNWSFVRDELVELHDLDILNNGSQFRSRDIYAAAVVRFLAGDGGLGAKLDPEDLPEVPPGYIAHIDGYGNLKLTTRRDQFPEELTDHPLLEVTIRGITHTVFNHLADNPAPVGEIGLLEGSSGGKDNRFLELVLRGGSAYQAFEHRPLVSDYSEPGIFIQ